MQTLLSVPEWCKLESDICWTFSEITFRSEQWYSGQDLWSKLLCSPGLSLGCVITSLNFCTLLSAFSQLYLRCKLINKILNVMYYPLKQQRWRFSKKDCKRKVKAPDSDSWWVTIKGQFWCRGLCMQCSCLSFDDCISNVASGLCPLFVHGDPLKNNTKMRPKMRKQYGFYFFKFFRLFITGVFIFLLQTLSNH